MTFFVTQQVTVYSTLPPQSYLLARAPPILAHVEEDFSHLVANVASMENFLASQQDKGILTSVGMYEKETGKVRLWHTLVMVVTIPLCI